MKFKLKLQERETKKYFFYRVCCGIINGEGQEEVILLTFSIMSSLDLIAKNVSNS